MQIKSSKKIILDFL